MNKTATLKRSDFQAKQDIYNNFPGISYKDKKEAINLIIKNNRSIPLKEACNKKKVWGKEIELFLERFGIDLEK